jgi:hypothetical protein
MVLPSFRSRISTSISFSKSQCRTNEHIGDFFARMFYALRSCQELILRNPFAAGNFGGMNPARATDDAYIHYLIGSPRVVSATEAARVQPDQPHAPAHDSFNGL